MPSSTTAKHDATKRWQALHFPSSKHSVSDYRDLLIRKMSELNTSSNNQHQLAAGLKAYENFCANDNTMPINPVRQLPQSPVQLKSRGMNGDDSPLSPSSPISWQDYQQTVQSLRQELEERKRNEAQLHHLVRALRQQQAALHMRDFDQINGPSLTPDGLPSAPSSDGIVESVKDGHIKRLGREITVLKANLHDAENRLSAAQKERDSAFQQVASLADSDRRAAILQHQVSEMQVVMASGGEKMDTLNETIEKQKAEINTLKESLQRLSRENQCLKETAAVMNSRQPASLGTSSGGSSVAGCSQELDYLHKVVDTLKATVQEQHSKLCSLRSLHDKSNPTPSTLGGPIKAQSFPIAPRPPASRVSPASLAAGVRRPEGRPVAPLDNSEWSVDGSGQHFEGLLRLCASAVTTTNNSTNLGIGNNTSVSTRANQAIQDDETVTTLGSVMEKLKIADSKPIPGVELGGRVVASESTSRSNTVENSGYIQAPLNNFNLTSQTKPVDPSGNNSHAAVRKVSAAAKPLSQVIASHRADIPASTVLTSCGSRPLSKSEVIGVTSGLGRPSINRSSSTHVHSGALSKILSAEETVLGRRCDPPLHPATMSTSVAGGVSASDPLSSQTNLVSGTVRAGVSSAAPHLSRSAQPQFVFEAEVEDSPGEGRPNYRQQVLNNYQQFLPPPAVTSSVFTPQAPPPTHQARAAPVTSPLATYQTASAAVTTDREGMHVLNKHMMGGGNVIYQQSPSQFLQPQQQMLLGGGSVLSPSSHILNFPTEPLRSRGCQQQQVPSTTTVSSAVDNQQPILYSNISHQAPSQQLDPSGPRVNSDRTCPVCSQDFSHVPMEDFQAHVYECFDEAGPETMKAPGEEKPSSGGNGGGTDRTCPVCNDRFQSDVPQSEFERHVHSHFGEEGFEIVS